MPVIDIHTAILVYGDSEVATSNPQRRFVDWARHVTGIAIEQPSVREYVAQPGELLSIYSGTRTTAIDGTSQFSIVLNPAKASVYRIKHTGGTAPAFRTARSYDGSGVLHTLSINNNATMTVTIGSGDFSLAGVQVGDVVFIPGISTGDAINSFNPNNVGFWTVLAVTATKLTLRRPVGEAFSGVAESVTPVSADELIIFSASGVQVGDTLEVSSGFSVVSQKSYQISAVTDEWVEFTSTENLPLETGVVPTAAGMSFYSDAKSFVWVEVDQDAVVRVNGDSGNTQRLSPRVSGDADGVAHYSKWGPTWSLAVLNRSSVSPMKVTVISVE